MQLQGHFPDGEEEENYSGEEEDPGSEDFEDEEDETPGKGLISAV